MKTTVRSGGMWRRGIRLICACAALLAVVGSTFAQATQVPELLEPVGVMTDTAKAYIGDISDIKAYAASVRPYVEGVSFSVSGIVDKVHVIIGQPVKAGDPLITLDQENQIERVESLSRQISQAETNSHYKEELSNIDRSILELELETLMVRTPEDTRAIELKKLEIEEFDLNAALEKELRSLEITRLHEELDTAEKQMVQSVITAPYDGSVIYLSDLVRGSYVNAFNPLVYIADDTRMSIETDYIMESIVKGADRIYAHVGGNTYDLEYVPMNPSELFAKTMSGEKIMSSFKIIDADDQVGMGDYAMVCVESNIVEDTLLIPRNALYIESSGRYVYVIEDGMHVHRDVEIGRMATHVVEIKSGLEEGEIVYVQE